MLPDQTVILVKGYNQVPMSEADICKTAIVTPFELFEFLYMQFGLKNAAQIFQRLMDRIFRGLPFVFIYLDDVLIASWTRKLHIEYLGHKITADGIVPLHRHVDALLLQPHPQDVRGLQRFLGIINFYRHFFTWDCKNSPPSH